MKLSLITDPHSRCFSTTLSTLISGNPHPIKFPSSFPLKKVSYSFPLTICLSKSLSTVDSQTHNQAPHGQIKSTEEIESLHVEVGSPKILPSLLLSTKFSLTDQAFFLLAFIACTTSVAFTSLVVAAVPTLFQESSKLENVSLLREPEDEPDVLIECRNVYKSFGDKHILTGVSFKIRHGEAVGIIGPSGTGKSTILKIMAGLLAPDKGEVLIRGKLRNGLVSDDEISGLRIGLVFQSAALFDSLTVRENVGFLLYENSTMPEDQIAQLVTETLAAVGLKEVEDRLPSELSGGMKKRVALARSIIFDTTKDTVEPEVLLYDEPTAGLDPIASTVVEDLIRSVHMTGEDALGKPGKIASYAVVTHQHSTIKRAVDRLLFLYEGKVVWQGMTREFSTSTNPIVRQFASGSLDGPIKY